MMSKADKFLSGLEEILDVLEHGLLLGRGRGVEPLEQDPAALRLGQGLRHHLLGVTLHLTAVPVEEQESLRIQDLEIHRD